jgi:glutamate-1-semialdehyde 2,1-aminomutase
MEDAFRRHGLEGRTTGRGSLCGAYFPYDPTTRVKNPEEMQTLTDMEKVDHEFRMRLLNHGVFVMHGGGALSEAHTDEDVDRILAAVDAVAEEMATSGR